MIEALWRQHYHPQVTASYHGDMAHAFKAMLADSWCTPEDREKMIRAIKSHKRMERLEGGEGRKWFNEAFPEI